MYQFDSRVRYSETDEQGRLSVTGILNYLQDCSTLQSEDIGLGIEYLKKSYIPRAAASGFLRTPYLRRILQDETEDATSYSVQFHVKNPETLEYWMQSEGRDLQQELVNRFGTKLVGFSTLLEEINLES